MKSPRVRRYQFSAALFAEMFQTGNEICVKVKSGLPQDATVVGVREDKDTYSFNVVVQSKQFAKVADGELIPYGEITLERLHNGQEDH